MGYGRNCKYTRNKTSHYPTITVGIMDLFSNIIHNIDDRLETVKKERISVDESIQIFSNQNHDQNNYTRNIHCWAYGLDLSCISPWNSNGLMRKAGTLLSPRHVIWARHFNIVVNTTIRFIDDNNQVFERIIIESQAVPDMSNSTSDRGFIREYDMVIGLLDSDVPSSISFAKVLPRYFQRFEPLSMFVRLPTLCTDSEEKALVTDFRRQRSNTASLIKPFRNTTRREYFEKKISGDSGNPCFFVMDNELVFLFVFTYGGAGSGTSIQYHHDDVNKIMRNLGGGYQLTEIDLSKYMSDHDITTIFG